MIERENIRIRILKDRIFLAGIIIFSSIIFLPIILIFFHIIANGLKAINIAFLISLPKPVGEAGGGIVNAIIGTLMLAVLASVIAIPPSICAGIYLAEHKRGYLLNTLSLVIEVLQGIPSIIFGIIAYIWVVKPMKHFSLLSGSIALSIMMIPVVAKATEETLKVIPNYIREAALALGVPYYRVILRVILPVSMTGITTGILIALARIMGETAPLLFTAFGNPYLNFNPTKPVDSLPLVIFNYAKSPFVEWHKLAWGASLILIILVLLINIITRWLTKRWKVQF